MAENPIDPSGAAGVGGRGGALKNLMLRLEIRSIKELNSEFNTLKTNLDGIRKTLGDIKSLGDVMGGLSGGGGGGTTAPGQRNYGNVVNKSASGAPAATVGDAVINEAVAGDNTRSRTRYLIHDPHGGGSGNLQGYTQSIGRSIVARSLESATSEFATSIEQGGGFGASLKIGATALRSGLSAGGGFGAAAVAAFGSQVLSDAGKQIGAAVDSRIERGYAYSLSADKMSVLYQQMTGMSQNQIMNAYRQPLTQYRLGEGGVNTLMGLQAQSGLSAILQGSSAEAIRTMSGYGYSVEDAARMIGSLGDVQTVNQMYMLTGYSLYGPGGKQNSALSVIQHLANLTNIDSEERMNQALGSGSITRARLAAMGVGEEMQTQVIQYAGQNAQFRARGGQGNYDPSREADRRLLNIEENFATQAEETIRQQMGREEQFYRRQADNFADLERMTQTLTRTFGKLEDELSGLIGAQISINPAAKVGGKIASNLGMGLMAGGAAVTAATGGPGAVLGIPMMALGGLLSIGGGFFQGDADSSGGGGVSKATQRSSGTRSRGSVPVDPNMRIPGVGGTVQGLMNHPTFANMQSMMKERVLNVIMEGKGRVGISNGWRSPEDQESLFLQRYRKTNRPDSTPQRNSSDRKYQGYWWEKHTGFDVAPPGRSFHEIGLAVDFTGDLQLASNIGKKYGLKTFENTSVRELHHAQPVETPNGWQEYINMGAPFGLPGNTSGSQAPGSELPGSSPAYTTENEDDTVAARRIQSLFGMSLSDILLSEFSGSSGGGGGGASDMPTSRSSVDFEENTTTEAYSGTLSGKQIVRVLKRAGLRGQDLVKGVGISYRESRWNPRAFNGNRGTGDKSYGLFQINMIDSLGPYRRELFGISRDDQLFNPNTNAAAMQKLRDVRRASGQNPWHDWGPYKGMSETYGVDMARAAATVRAAERKGDAPVVSGSSGGNTSKPMLNISRDNYQAAASLSRSNVNVAASNSYNVTVSPTINMSGGAGPQDLKRMAREIGKLIEQETKHVLMREN